GAEGWGMAVGEPPAGSPGAIEVPSAKVEASELDPTGVGDAYRAGLLAARLAGVPWDVAGRIGSVAAVYALETIGPQPRAYSLAEFRARFEAKSRRRDAAQLARLGA